jgi:hypothetical protein
MFQKFGFWLQQRSSLFIWITIIMIATVMTGLVYFGFVVFLSLSFDLSDTKTVAAIICSWLGTFVGTVAILNNDDKYLVVGKNNILGQIKKDGNLIIGRAFWFADGSIIKLESDLCSYVNGIVSNLNVGLPKEFEQEIKYITDSGGVTFEFYFKAKFVLEKKFKYSDLESIFDLAKDGGLATDKHYLVCDMDNFLQAIVLEHLKTQRAWLLKQACAENSQSEMIEFIWPYKQTGFDNLKIIEFNLLKLNQEGPEHLLYR